MALSRLDGDIVRMAENDIIRMEENHIWPNGLRYLWTDAFGLVLLSSLYGSTGKDLFLEKAERLVGEVDRVLGRPRGYRIGEAPERDGQYYHYQAMWVYALWKLGAHDPDYHDKAIGIVKDIHSEFVLPGTGVVWKMEEDLSRSYPGTGLGALDPFHGYVVYRLLDPEALQSEIREMKALVDQSAPDLRIEQDLGLGMMLWMTHFFPDEEWAQIQRKRSLKTLDMMWVDPPGYFSRTPGDPQTRFAFTNYGVGIGLQAVDEHPDRVERLLDSFREYRSGDQYDIDPITHVMRTAALYPEGFLAPGRR